MIDYIVVREILIVNSEGCITGAYRKACGIFRSKEGAFSYGSWLFGNDLYEIDGGWYITELVPQ